MARRAAIAPPRAFEAIRGREGGSRESGRAQGGSVRPQSTTVDSRSASVYDITNKPSGKRFTMDEVGLFTVVNGKITREEFFYPVG